MDPQARTRRILKDVGAFKDGGHYVYSSGLHGDFYLNKDALYTHPLKLDDICVMLTDLAVNVYGNIFDTVLAPAIGGIVLGQNIAYNAALNRSEEVYFAYAEKHPANKYIRTIRRGYQHVIRGRNVLLVDDVITTGATLVGMAQAVYAMGESVIGSVVICDRGSVRTLKYDLENTTNGVLKQELAIAPLVELDLKTFKPNVCPFCKIGRPVDTDLGEGYTFLKDTK
jgi:orotate phosphoribosyltransferase